MSNTSDLAEIVGVNTTAVKAIGASIGVIADVAGALSGIGAAADVVMGLLTSNKDQLAPILEAINEGFANVNEHLKASNTVTALRDNDRIWAEAQSVEDGLKAALDAVPPLDFGTRLLLVTKCREAVDNLSPPGPLGQAGGPGPWMIPSQDSVFFDDKGDHLSQTVVRSPITWPDGPYYWYLPFDSGYGVVAPPIDPSGVVFYYIYVLPSFLYVESIFLNVGSQLLPDFATGYAVPIGRDADFLQRVHDKIVGGIRLMVPPAWDVPDLFLSTWTGWGSLPRGTEQKIDRTSIASLSVFLGLVINYGAVEYFSGASKAARYQLLLSDVSQFGAVPLEVSSAPPEITALASNPAIYRKFQIRVVKQSKDLYQLLGLADVWKMIHRLRTFGSLAETIPPSYADWSFRDLCTTAGDSVLTSSGDFSFSQLFDFLLTTPPNDLPERGLIPYTFRSLLDDFVSAP